MKRLFILIPGPQGAITNCARCDLKVRFIFTSFTLTDRRATNNNGNREWHQEKCEIRHCFRLRISSLSTRICSGRQNYSSSFTETGSPYPATMEHCACLVFLCCFHSCGRTNAFCASLFYIFSFTQSSSSLRLMSLHRRWQTLCTAATISSPTT